ncbi:HAD-IIB family hydrolase [Spiroplasma tabanidicola]|uniref:Cof-type HAD-IIB family hydrolase n=1 Tax=Spiroplasma tabanidicola TaxID=324079 RepID=A0A6I6CHF2_9MOLU|nr:HAD-IIB family hydrolase [Spiroplasma tabanidicola]QGS51463.1 Cof-type HAD-IIB family hydrolase [Spiroplasma tabanidicola]
MNKKWWFSDYDGTILIDSIKGVTKKDWDFINKWIKDGNNFVIASGRNRDDVKSILKEANLNYNYLITNNGAMVHDKNDNIILHRVIPMDVRKDILKLIEKWMDKVGIELCFGNESMIVSILKEKRKDVEPDQLFEKIWTFKPNVNKDFQDQVLKDLNLDTVKFFSYYEDLEAIENDFKKLNNTRYMQTYYFVLELTNKDTSKLDGIKQIQNIYNIDEKDIYTTGDGENDVEMLKGFQNSFAIESGNKKALAAGKHIIKAVNELQNYI